MPIRGQLPDCYFPSEKGHYCSLCDKTFPSFERLISHDVSLGHRLLFYTHASKADLNRSACPVCSYPGLISRDLWFKHERTDMHHRCVQQYRSHYLKQGNPSLKYQYIRPPQASTDCQIQNFDSNSKIEPQKPAITDLKSQINHTGSSKSSSNGEMHKPEHVIFDSQEDFKSIQHLDLTTKTELPKQSEHPVHIRFDNTSPQAPSTSIDKSVESSLHAQEELAPPKSNSKSKKREFSNKSRSTPHESKPETSTPKNSNKRTKTPTRNDLSKPKSKKSNKKDENFEVEQNLVEFDVTSAAKLSACKSVFSQLRKEKEALDFKMYKLFKKMQKLMMERNKTLLQIYDQYPEENREKHNLAVKVLRNFMMKQVDNSEPIQFLDEDVGEPLARDLRQGVNVLHRLSRAKDWISFDDKIFSRLGQMNDESENKDLDETGSLNMDPIDNVQKDAIPQRLEHDRFLSSRNDEEFCPPDSSTCLPLASPSTPMQRQEHVSQQDPIFIKSEPIDSPKESEVQEKPGLDLDYQRLELIREALRHPDSSDYTCENFHLMLQKIAKSKGLNPETYFPEASMDVEEPLEMTEPSAEFRPPPSVHIQHELPQVAQIKLDSISPQLKKRPISPQPIVNHAKKSKLSVPEVVNDSELLSGDFHAFGNKITAVVDMHIVQSSSLDKSTVKLLAGSQDGTINLLDLQKKSILRTFIRQGNSVTKMCLNSNHSVLISGFYDNKLYAFRVRDGFQLHCKTLSGRLECCTFWSPSVSDQEFLIGMSTGEVLKFALPEMGITQLYRHFWNKKTQQTSAYSSECAISSMAVIPAKPEPVLVVGAADCSITVRSLTSGALLRTITVNQHMASPMGLTKFPYGSECIILSYSAKTFKLHDIKSDSGIFTLTTPGITSCCLFKRFVASGDADGAIRVYKTIWNSINNRPYKVFFAKAKSAVTCLTSVDSKLLAGSMDGSITVVTVNDGASNNYLCEYNSSLCQRRFENILDLVDHVYETHLLLDSTSKKSYTCGWASGRCKHRFMRNQSLRSVRDHLLSHLSNKSS